MEPIGSSDTDPPADFALLLVHGIGQPRAGSVVGQIGNALLDWFSARLPGRQLSVEVERAMLKPAQRGRQQAACATLVVRDSAGVPVHRVCLVESLWAEEFDPPGFVDVLRWILGPGSWLLFRHFVHMPMALLRSVAPGLHRPSSAVRLLSSVCGVVAFFFLVLPIQLIGIVLALLRLLPLPRIAALQRVFGVIVSEVLGDSYLFARDPVVRRALADRVRVDLQTLRAQGAPVAILAHSQGAAVAFHMLEQLPDPPPLVTYGAGIRKLHEVTGAPGRQAWIPTLFYGLWWLAPLWVAALVGAVDDVQRAFAGSTSINQWGGVSWLVLMFLYLAGFLFGQRANDVDTDIDESLAQRIDRLLKRQAAWLDLFASHDPVPDGPLLRTPQANSGPAIDSRWIVNQMRTASDHTSYWANPDGFIDPLMRWLATTLHQPWLPVPAQAAPTWWCRAYRTRVLWVLDWALRLEVIVLWWRARTPARELLPKAEAVASQLAASMPDMLAGALPLLRSVVMAGYGSASLLLLLLLHLLGLKLYRALLLQAHWQALDRHLALQGLLAPIKPVWRALLFAAFYLLAHVALVQAIVDASYAPLLRMPADLLLDVHRWLFIGG